MLNNFWYAVHESAEIGDKPTKLRALGRELVLVRGEDGVVLALDDRCPHRGAALSAGWREDPSGLWKWIRRSQRPGVRYGELSSAEHHPPRPRPRPRPLPADHL